MSSAVLAPKTDAANTPEFKQPRVSILIPAFGAAASLRNCLHSLAQFAPANCTIYVLDDGTPDGSLRETCEQFGSSLPQLHYIRSEVNRGFVHVCNWGWENIRRPESDLLVLDSNTEVTAGFLEELQTVLYFHERHGVVSPRSNNATIFSIPISEASINATESFEIWLRIRHSLPRYQVMPTAAGFCMLIKAEILKRFGLFDEAYSPKCNEENDFVCRINRYGYSAVAANWAYVFHTSIEPQARALEEAHRDILRFRYPEYERKIADYERFHQPPLERFASLYAPHKPRILYDLFHLTPAHTGTSDFGLSLLRELARNVRDEFELWVGMYQPERFFAHELAGYRIYEDQLSREVFDLAFKPCQASSWTELRRMARLAPRVAYTMLDIIGVRCEYMTSPGRQILLQRAAELADCMFTISEFSRSDFAAFYGLDVHMQIIPLGTNFGMTTGEFRRGEYVLLVGNNFIHKGVREAIQHLGTTLPVVVLGGKPESVSANVRHLESGKLSRQHVRELFINARVLVYPSYYEGFGLPVIDALALGKPVVVLDSAVNRELDSTLADPNFYRISSMQELGPLVAKLFWTEATKPGKELRRWRHVAEDYAQAFRELLGRDFNPAKVHARWQTLRTLESARLVESI